MAKKTKKTLDYSIQLKLIKMLGDCSAQADIWEKEYEELVSEKTEKLRQTLKDQRRYTALVEATLTLIRSYQELPGIDIEEFAKFENFLYNFLLDQVKNNII
jgi:hypothetical protein